MQPNPADHRSGSPSADASAEWAESSADQQVPMVAEAVKDWRSTSRGEGHAAFFRLALALQRAGLDDAAI